MSNFFIPGAPRDREGLERAYERLRDEAEAETGEVVRDRRIFKLACRRNGRDLEAKVGKLDPIDGGVVMAILDIGHGVYTIRCAENGDRRRSSPILVGKRQVYSVTEFTA